MRTMAERLKLRLRVGRPMTTVSIRLPKDVVEDLQEIAPVLGLSGYQPLMRAYIGQGLRTDLEKLDGSKLAILTDCLRRNFVSDEVISEAVAEAQLRIA